MIALYETSFGDAIRSMSLVIKRGDNFTNSEYWDKLRCNNPRGKGESYSTENDNRIGSDNFNPNDYI